MSPKCAGTPPPDALQNGNMFLEKARLGAGPLGAPASHLPLQNGGHLPHPQGGLVSSGPQSGHSSGPQSGHSSGPQSGGHAGGPHSVQNGGPGLQGVAGGRLRPIDTLDRCDFKTIQKTCSLFGLDLVSF